MMNKFHLIFTIVLGFVAIAFADQTAVAQSKSWDYESYVRGKDRNGDGMLQPNEIEGSRLKGYLQGAGIDTNKTNSISKVIKQLKNKESKKSKRPSSTGFNTKGQIEIKVPGFGLDEEPEKADVAGFTGGSLGNYSEGVLKQVDETLGRYDRDKNGLLDKEEISKGRWGRPSPQESDSNGDGVLSRTELANRYKAREKVSEKIKSTPSSTSSSRSSRDSRSSTRGRADRSSTTYSSRDRRSSDRSYTSSSSNTGSSKSSSGSSSSSAASSGSEERYRKYAKQLMDRYDADKDGSLSRSEVSKMRSKPKDADADKDGKISLDELTNSYLSPSKKTTSGDAKKEDSKTSSKGSSSSSRTSSYSRSRSRTSSSFSKLDKNEDGQVHMHEYASASDWDDDTVDEFREKDKNDDGVITSAEWNEK